MYILGISAFYHDSAAALVENGRIIFACQEDLATNVIGINLTWYQLSILNRKQRSPLSRDARSKAVRVDYVIFVEA